MVKILRIISGGQTGADRGALDAAIRLGIPHGGACPKGRLAEDGVIPERYALSETDSDKYPPRTALNVKQSDATLVLSHDGIFDRGTALTLKLIEQMGKPYVKMSLKEGLDQQQLNNLAAWLDKLATRLGHPITVNVAGPRESRVPGLQEHVCDFLMAALNESGMS